MGVSSFFSFSPSPSVADDDSVIAIPMNEYYEYFGPTYKLDVPPSNMDDLNTREYLEKIKMQVFENLRHTGSAPSVQTQRTLFLMFRGWVWRRKEGDADFLARLE